MKSAKFEALFKEAANRVLIVRCMTALDLVAALRNVHSVISAASVRTSSASSERPSSPSSALLLIDNITAFYWTLKTQQQMWAFHASLARQIADLLR